MLKITRKSRTTTREENLQNNVHKENRREPSSNGENFQ